jgi:peptidoglycan/LPS O-acetylase OafA/YrhL
MFHFGTLMVIASLHESPRELNSPTDVVLYLTVSFLLAGLVYHFIEKPMEKIRRRFRAEVKA